MGKKSTQLRCWCGHVTNRHNGHHGGCRVKDCDCSEFVPVQIIDLVAHLAAALSKSKNRVKGENANG